MTARISDVNLKPASRLIRNVLNMFDLNPFAEENGGLSRQSTKQAVHCKVYALERARVMKQVHNLCLRGAIVEVNIIHPCKAAHVICVCIQIYIYGGMQREV